MGEGEGEGKGDEGQDHQTPLVDSSIDRTDHLIQIAGPREIPPTWKLFGQF
ncbi:hypothetical protein CsSME_00018008 [Camellia sinensis var. sinensis]